MHFHTDDDNDNVDDGGRGVEVEVTTANRDKRTGGERTYLHTKAQLSVVPGLPSLVFVLLRDARRPFVECALNKLLNTCVFE